MNDRFQILALDGGGLKGLFSAAVLANLERDLKTRIIDHFDLIVGTSTGGIIALALALQIRPAEIVRFYTENGSRIFRQAPWKGIQQFFWSKHSNATLKKVLQEYFRDHVLYDCRKRLVIPSFNIDSNDVYLFKTPHHPRFRRDYRARVWEVAMATSAAPTFLPVFSGIDSIRMVDGGVWANNPALIGIIEAVKVLNTPLDSISMLSIGTSDAVYSNSRALNRGGFLQWILHGRSILMNAQCVGINRQASLLLGKEKMLRLNPKVPKGLFALDRLTSDKHISAAASESRHLSPEVATRFMQHRAREYTPSINIEQEAM